MAEFVDDIRAAYERRRAAAGGQDDTKPEAPFVLRPIDIIDQRSIPHRQWIYGHHLIRGFVTLLVAPGAVGKSSMVLGICMALATNRRLLGSTIFQQCNVALLNLEDPQEEIDRRVTALALHYGITNADLGGRLFASPAGRNVRIAENGPDGFSIVHPDEREITERVRDERIGVLVVDPFAESHTLEENSNPQMIQAAAAWRRVARAGDCSVLLTHHVRKGPVESIEAARGAKALTDSARIGLLLSTMTDREAEDLGIQPEHRLQYVRLDDAKANMAARAPKASWFHLRNVTLDNADETYAEGDKVVVIEVWHPPADELSTAPNRELNTALDAIKAGPSPGVLYTKSRRGDSARWCGRVLCDAFQVLEKQAAKMIDAWFRSGLLYEVEYPHPQWRRKTKGVAVSDRKRPT